MPINFNIPLPGPFSYSTRVTPNIGKTVRQVSRAAGSMTQQDRCTCSRPARRPVQPRREVPQYYEPVEPSKIPPTPRFMTVIWALVLLNLTLLALWAAVA